MKNKYPDSRNIEVIGKDSEGNDRIIVNPISHREAYDELWKRRLDNNQCPKCLCILKETRRYSKCDVCNLLIDKGDNDSASRKKYTTTKKK